MIAHVLVVLTACAVAATSSAQGRPDFSGRWKLDSVTTLGGGTGDNFGRASGGGGGGGGGTGLGPAASQLAVQMTDTSLRVEELRDDETATLVYRLDGKAMKNEMTIGRGRAADARFVSRWEERRLITSITATLGSARGVRMEYREQRYLPDTATMIVHVSLVGRPAGRRAYYSRLP